MLHRLPFMTLEAQADFQGTVWSVYATGEANESFNDVQHTCALIFVNNTSTTCL